MEKKEFNSRKISYKTYWGRK